MFGHKKGEEWIFKSLDKVIDAKLQKLVGKWKTWFAIISYFNEDHLMITYDASLLKGSFLIADASRTLSNI